MAEAVVTPPAAPETPPAGAPPMTGAPATPPADPKPAMAPAAPPTDKPTGETVDPGKEAAEKQATEKAAKAAEAPEKYDLKLPEGVIVDDEIMGEFTGWAKEQKLSNEQAQKAADLHMKVLSKFATQQAHEFQEQNGKWRDAAIALPEIGGAKIDAARDVAGRVFGRTDDKTGKEFVAPMAIPNVSPAQVREFREELNRTGLGNHPVMFAVAHMVGSMLGEDGKFVIAKTPSGPKSAQEVMYGSESK